MKATRIVLALVLLVAMLCAVAHADDGCLAGGELRREHNCLSVRHTKKDVCCWLKADGTHGRLPYSCCGTGWDRENCAEIVDRVCETHHEDL